MISISVFDRLIKSNTFVERISRPERYNHTINAVGGYWSARFSVGGQLLDMDDWVANGLGRHIEVTDSGQVWEGFVNKVTANYGPLTVTIGPLLDIANRVDLVYSAVDTTTDPPTVGLRLRVGVANDTDSQVKWGIIPKILSTGGVDEDDAGEGTQIRDIYLEENKYPQTSNRWSSTSGKSPTITLECLGYVHWLLYPYNNKTTGMQNASTKITTILNATYNPNDSWLPFGVNYVDANTVQVKAWENDDNLAFDLIKDAVERGDTSNNRWLFGVYADREAYYREAPDDIEYHQALSDPALRVVTPAGAEVKPWNVLPGKWLLFTDFLAGQDASSFSSDPTTMFIESVRFRAPDQLTLTGGRTDTLSQYIAQLGLSGVGG